MSFFSGPLSSSTQGRSSNRGSERNAAQPSRPRWPSPGSAWRSTLEPSGVCGVVEVQRPEAVQPDDGVELVDHAAQPLRGPHVVARGEQVAGVQAHAEPLVAARQLDQRRELLERAPERPPGAGGVLEVQRAGLRLGERLRDRRRRALERRLHRAAALQSRARVQHDAVRAQRRARLQRGGQRRQRLPADLGILGGAVEQVDGVDHQRLERRVRHRGVERVDLLGRVDPRPPRPRALVEELDRVAASLHASLHRLRGATCRGDVCADEHEVWTPALHGMLCPDARAIRSLTDGRPAHRGCADGTVQLAPGPRQRRPVPAPDRGHRPRALDPGERRADLRRPALARARLGRGARVPVRARRAPRRGRAAAARRGPRLPLHAPAASRSRPGTRSTATAASAARTRGRARCACASPTRARPSSATSSAARARSRTRSRTTS